ncbi:MAG: NrfD/PsrC family molybdoenzyme membrane anchor subunit [Candidatus Rokuibacteriota bacterium]
MEPVVLWQHKWSADLFIPGYLFFGGLSGGLVVVAALADLLGLRFPRLAGVARLSALTALVTLGVAGFLLTVHLGKPERGLGFPIFFTNYNSWMTRGGWVVGAAAAVAFAYAALWYFRVMPGLRRVLAVVLIPLGGLLAFYTGLLLSGAGYVPLWSGRYLPQLFLTSGLTTGVATAGLVTVVGAWILRHEAVTARRWLGVALLVLLVVEVWELGRFMTFLEDRAPDKSVTEWAPNGRFMAPMGSRLAYQYVTGGPGYPWALVRGGDDDVVIAGGQRRDSLASWFWLGVIGLGFIVPIALTVAEFLVDRRNQVLAERLAVAKFASVLVGAFILRAVVVWGGDLKAPLPMPPQHWPVGLPPITGLGG